MIPSVLATQLQKGIGDFLKTTFPIATPHFHGLLERLLDAPGTVFKGPYLTIALPFQPGKSGPDYFPEIPLAFRPYHHQQQAFERLGGSQPRSTLVATGTGSGKTESFLYPILDHCYRHRSEAGIKAILIYPMNALASDQAQRLAKLIWTNTKLRGNVTAGLFVGQSERDPAMAMGPENVISHKDTQRLNPPDILLTNYKMLDYLLIRPKDAKLWQQNRSETLQFLVVDELHTFDGAQGTDLACLVRRLKARLGTPADFLCCVGTSATLGSPEEAGELSAYAAQIFGESFDERALITESRFAANGFLGDSLIRYLDIVPHAQADQLAADAHSGYTDYIRAQHVLWFNETIARQDFAAPEWRVDLAKKLRSHYFFQNLLKVLDRLDASVASYKAVLAELERVTPALKTAPDGYRRDLLDSLLALLAEARIWVPESDADRIRREAAGTPRPTAPFLQLRVQFWLRELRRMVVSVAGQPALRFFDDLKSEQIKTHLPAIHCRECGSMAWGALENNNDHSVVTDLQDFYMGFFNGDPRVRFLFPGEDALRGRESESGIRHVCAHCLHLTGTLNPAQCPSCGHPEMVRVFVHNTQVKRGNRVVTTHDCPYCDAHESLTILGSRAASLTSVLIAQLYASSFNDDKKLLAFSDAVQDAAHRAGFFAARTWRFNLRTALQQFLMAEGDGMTLAALPGAFARYWSERLPPETYVTTFLAPNMGWLRDFDLMKRYGRLPDGSMLIQDLDRRLGWEITSEYGFSARIGRTLEKSGCSVVHAEPNLLDQAVERLRMPLSNEIGALRDLSDERLRRFLVGLLVHLKNQGAVFHDVLRGYVADGGKTYLITQRHIHWMPNFGPRTRAPGFLTDKSGSSRFESVLGSRSWCQRWAEKCFQDNPLISAETDRLYGLILKALVEVGLLEAVDSRGQWVWGILPQGLRVSTDVVGFRCERCGHNLSLAAADLESGKGMACLRSACGGIYQEEPDAMNYYGKLYASGQVTPIISREHTGLLTRDQRDELERDFKARSGNRRPWYPNLLSCTPTLEMGIDVGDLSSVILCSVPPAQASYLQRAGRAGRKDGNALALTVANGTPHDLYFYTAPEEMMAGKVETPGVFLNASAVLERQFTAFCFDSWVAEGAGEAALPARLGQVLNQLEPVNPIRFPYNLLRFIENHQTRLMDGFMALFAEALSEDSVSHLRTFVDGDGKDEGSLRWRVSQALALRRRERDSLSKKVRVVRDRIRRKEQDPAKGQNYEEELDELKREKSALQNFIRGINDKDTLNFFTDEGLIPNYAFPQAGVVLRSTIYRRREKAREGEGRYENWCYEYERPAASAIAEFAPENVFYAGGRKVRIDQVDMETAEVELWRFCDSCSYLERVMGDGAKSSCPQCGSLQWADEGQQRQLLRMRTVFATTSDRDSRIGDDSDDRAPTFYNRQMLVNFADYHVTDAWHIDSEAFPFGFEFLSRVTLREINFGEKGEFGDKLVIAGVDLPRKGFTVCRVCGKVQDARGTIQHALNCTARDRESDKSLTDCVFLYREFESEAIRMLLPVTTFAGSERRLHSFVAALQLGLKRQFGGGIDHLRTTVYEEPVAESLHRKKYLVLYDTVPGGTGYLKQLMRSPEPLLDIFQQALEALRACVCNQLPDKDGCYRCLYAYRNSYDMAETSRDTAADMLQTILAQRDHLQRVDTLRQVPCNGLFDSELEARFIEALRRVRQDGVTVTLSKVLTANGRPGYRLQLPERIWYIELQVKLGSGDGVAVPSRADFVFRPAREQDDILPVVVFTDGYLYHRHRIGEDMAQRMAIAQSGRYHVWSLSWKDVEHRFKPQGGYFQDFLKPNEARGQQQFGQLLAHYDAETLRGLLRADSLEWFIAFLRQPDRGLWRRFAFVQGLMHLDHQRFSEPAQQALWFEELQGSLPGALAQQIEDLPQPRLYGRCDPAGGRVRLFAASAQDAIRTGDAHGMGAVCCLADEPVDGEAKGFEPVWNGFLRLYNLFQFLPNAFFVTQQGRARHVYDGLQPRKPEKPSIGSFERSENWTEIYELADPQWHGLIDKLVSAHWPLAEVGFELASGQGEVIATAELAWEDLRIAFLPDEDEHSDTAFREAGWQTAALSEILSKPEDYVSLHNLPQGRKPLDRENLQ